MKAKTVAILILLCLACTTSQQADQGGESIVIQLPRSTTSAPAGLAPAIAARRSVRNFLDESLSDAQVGQLLWAGQGITSPNGRRTVPSAGAIYPMTLIAVRPDGTYAYDPQAHALNRIVKGDLRADLSAAALSQRPVADAPLVIVIAAEVPKTARKYGDRAVRYCDLEAGHIAQNIALQAVALNLGLVTIGAFDDNAVRKLLGLPGHVRICYLLPVGRPAM